MYADDTLLIGVANAHVNEYLHAVANAGRRYGMELHWDKFQVLPVRMDSAIKTVDGHQLESKERMQYLGTVLSADGDMDHELNRRIAAAKQDFYSVKQLWLHSSLTRIGPTARTALTSGATCATSSVSGYLLSLC